MSQIGYTPIKLYYSSTPAAVPVNTDLSNGELAINIADGVLFYKDDLGTVQIIATKTSSGFTWPGAGIPKSTGSAWGTSYTTSGSGSVLALADSPVLVTPNLGTPSAATLTNATGLPISSGISGLGTGVATALAVNVGSAGAPVVNGGALGTPSSGTLTNATGLPISSGISGLGTGVATALAVNVGLAGAPVVNGGALGTPSSGTLTNATGLPISGGTTGTLPVARGGTGLTSFSANQVFYASSTSAVGQSANFTFGGNTIGLGTTLQTWLNTARAFQFGDTGVLAYVNSAVELDENIYYDAANVRRYITTFPAARFSMNGGTFQWSSAGSGSAGSVVGLTEYMRLNASGNLGIGTPSPVTKLDVNGSVSFGAPVYIDTTTYNVTVSDVYLIYTSASNNLTITLPTASSFTGRMLWIKQTSGKLVISASSNVVPRAGGAAGTAICSATAGSWAHMVSDGTNWVIMAG